MVTIHEGCTDLILNTWIGASLLTFDHGMMKCFIWIDMRIFFCLSTSSGPILCDDLFGVISYSYSSNSYANTNTRSSYFFCHFHREHFFSLLVILFIFFGTFCSRRRSLSWNKYKFKYILSYWLEL